jgi:hypothetical protein
MNKRSNSAVARLKQDYIRLKKVIIFLEQPFLFYSEIANHFSIKLAIQATFSQPVKKMIKKSARQPFFGTRLTNQSVNHTGVWTVNFVFSLTLC